MNIQLVNAIIQMTQTLSNEEQALLIQELNKSWQAKAYEPSHDLSVSVDRPVEIDRQKGIEAWEALKNLARPSGKTDIAENHDKYLYGKPL